jgi:hypothetical protein
VCSDDFDLARIDRHVHSSRLGGADRGGHRKKAPSIYAESLGVKVQSSTTGRNIERRMRGEPELAK